MSPGGRSLSSKQVRALEALVSGRTQEEAAQLAGVSVRSVKRWVKAEHFEKALSQERLRMVEAVGAGLLAMGEDALEALQAVMAHPGMKGANVKRLAAVSVLDLILRYRSQVELEGRVAALEQLAGIV